MDEKISEKSFLQIKRSIELTSKLKLKYFTFHAGFTVDPQTLGKRFSRNNVVNRKIAFDRYIDSLWIIIDYVRSFSLANTVCIH